MLQNFFRNALEIPAAIYWITWMVRDKKYICEAVIWAGERNNIRVIFLNIKLIILILKDIVNCNQMIHVTKLDSFMNLLNIIERK